MITGKAKLAGVMGWPVSHSLSPLLHGFWLHQHGIDGAYVPLPVAPDDFDTALRALPKLGFQGVNVTVPHKEQALACCDELNDAAKAIGAVNTIVFDDGKIVGSNTDGFGFMENLKGSAMFDRAVTRPAMILGAGGASRSIIWALQMAGVPSIRITNRTESRAQALADHFGQPVEVVAWDDRAQALDGVGLLVNTTSLGMTGQPPLDLSLDALPETALVTDIVYAPLITPVLEKASARGNPTVDGLGMLLHQARPGFEAWFGQPVSVTEDMRAAILGWLASKDES